MFVVIDKRGRSSLRAPLVLTNMRICILIPVFNEEAVIEESVETILSYAERLPCETHLFIVNDGSTDRTEAILTGLMERKADSGLKVIRHESNQGYGAALRTGIQHAVEHGYDYVLFMDSDLTNHPRYLERFYKKMEEGCDYIKATRYAKGGGVEGVPLGKRIISATGNFIAKILFGLPLTDFTNGFRAVKTDILRKMNLTEKGFVIIMEELYQAKGLARSFCDVPYVLTSRGQGKGQTHFSYSPRVCLQYFSYAVKSFLKRK